MRQINADELIELIDSYIKTADHTDRSASFVDGMKDGYYRIRNKILNMPSEPSEIIHCRDCKHYYFADNRIPQEQRYVCDIGGEVWQPDDFCSYGEKKEMDNFRELVFAQPYKKMPVKLVVDNWIPCGRKIPEEKGMYLTTTIDKEVYCDYWDGTNFNRTELVIAWLPLPLPYEGDNDGTNR